MEPNEEKEEPTIKDLMAKFEEFGTRLTALETPPEEEDDDKELEDEEKKDKEMNDDPDPVAIDEADKPADSDPSKSFEEEEKKIELAAKRGAEMAIKAFSASLGITKLGKPGVASPSKPTVKHFAEYVADLSVDKFDGDQNKATAHILSNKAKFGDAWKAYEAQRTVKS